MHISRTPHFTTKLGKLSTEEEEEESVRQKENLSRCKEHVTSDEMRNRNTHIARNGRKHQQQQQQ